VVKSSTIAASKFGTTHWSVVLAARQANPKRAQQAMERLCRTYWFPLYSYLRGQGYPSEDAKDLVQGLFEQLLERDFLKSVDTEKGRFRSFLLRCLRNFIANERDWSMRLKRGGQQWVLSLDTTAAEERYQKEPASPGLVPDRYFERQWALAVIETVLTRLQDEAAARGKKALFKHLEGTLVGEKPRVTHTELARGLGMSEGAVRVAVHRLRERFGELFREEIMQTVSQPEDLDDEVQYLWRVLSE
jgi:RNA polymerase sigma factor (sigma-70 family)